MSQQHDEIQADAAALGRKISQWVITFQDKHNALPEIEVLTVREIGRPYPRVQGVSVTVPIIGIG